MTGTQQVSTEELSGAEWVERARETANRLAPRAEDRDVAAAPSVEDVALLKDNGLVTLVAPAEYGGGGQRWDTALAVIREIARVDGGLAQVLGWNLLYYNVVDEWATPEQHARILGGLTADRALLAGSVNLTDDPYAGVDAGDHVVLNGFKAFNTGLPLADRTLANVLLPDAEGWFVVLLPPPAAGGSLPDGLTTSGTWDTLGARSTASGPVAATDLAVPWSDALGFSDKQFQPRPGNAIPGLPTQLILANVYLGLARGAFDGAVSYIAERRKPWLHSGAEKAVDEPHVQEGVGALAAELWSLETFVDTVDAELGAALADVATLTPERRAELSVRIGAAKTVATRVTLDTTSRALELSGARSTARSFGLERLFRDARTQTLHDPVAYKRRQIGRWVLTDEQPGPLDFYA